MKESTVFIAEHQARRMDSSCSEDPDFPMAFREGLLKATFGVRVAPQVTLTFINLTVKARNVIPGPLWEKALKGKTYLRKGVYE